MVDWRMNLKHTAPAATVQVSTTLNLSVLSLKNNSAKKSVGNPTLPPSPAAFDTGLFR